MQEITVSVQQDPGKVSWNYEEIKRRLKADLEVYRKTVYTDETIKSAKVDLASLRKLSTQINDRKKEIKSRFMEPYDQFEGQVKEILGLINEPIKAINDQVADYERRRKETARAEILGYWQTASAVLPEGIRNIVWQKIYDSRWENASATKKSWHDGIDSGIAQIRKDLNAISEFQSEFENEMYASYFKTLSLADAVRKMRELEDQKQKILERERLRREAEERRKAEEEARQEAIRKISYEKPAVIEVPKQEPAHNTQNRPCTGTPVVLRPEPEHQKAQEQAQQTRPDEPAQPFGNRPHEAVNVQEQATDGRQTITLRITGTPEQIRKIKGYIAFIKAEQKEVSDGIDG